MEVEQLETAIKEAYPDGDVLGLEKIEGLPGQEPLFGGLLVDVAFEGKSSIDRFYDFIARLEEHLHGLPLPEVKLALLSTSEFKAYGQPRAS